MLPTPTITTLSIARLDIGHHLGLNAHIPVGAAILTARLDGRAVLFTLEGRLLQPSDDPAMLLGWLDGQLTGIGSTIAGYRLDDIHALLAKLPNAERSPCLRTLAGCGPQPLLDLSAQQVNGRPLTFAEACTWSDIICTSIDPDARFAAWCRSDIDRIDHETQVDAIAAFRLILHRMSATAPIGRKIAAAMSTHFAAWLREADNAAAQLHASNLGSLTA